MSQRLEALADRQEILDCSVRYLRGQDRGLPGLQRTAFHPDAEVDYGFFRGPADAFVDFAQGVLANYRITQHVMGQADIHISGEEASGEIYFFAYHRRAGETGPEDLMIAGRYVDRYQRRSGVWRISFRMEIVDWTQTMPASDQWFERTPLALRGTRGPEDASFSILPPRT